MAGRKRHDPVARAADGRQTHDQIRGKDPTRKYCLVHPDAVDTYLSLGDNIGQNPGFIIEVNRPDGPRSAGRKLPDGSEVRNGGHTLMSCPQDEWDAYQTVLSRQSFEVEARILKDEGLMADGLRGRILGMRNVYGDDRGPEFQSRE